MMCNWFHASASILTVSPTAGGCAFMWPNSCSWLFSLALAHKQLVNDCAIRNVKWKVWAIAPPPHCFVFVEDQWLLKVKKMRIGFLCFRSDCVTNRDFSSVPHIPLMHRNHKRDILTVPTELPDFGGDSFNLLQLSFTHICHHFHCSHSVFSPVVHTLTITTLDIQSSVAPCVRCCNRLWAQTSWDQLNQVQSDFSLLTSLHSCQVSLLIIQRLQQFARDFIQPTG